jgi:PKD repeat protein
MQRRRPGVRSLLLAITVSLVLVGGAVPAGAVIVDAAPTWPVPTDPLVGPPLIPPLPQATAAAPPPGAIADPVRPGSVCGDWYVQDAYGARWPAPSAWWEYRCTSHDETFYNPCPGPACDAFCPYCYWQVEDRADYFFWNGSDAVFDGEAYEVTVVYGNGWTSASSYWWDAATASWYTIPVNAAPTVTFTVACTERTCVFDAADSYDPDGSISSYRWDFGDGTTETSPAASHTYGADGGFVVTLMATDDGGAASVLSRLVTVAANVPPVPDFTFTCSGPICSFDGTGSTDTDGTISRYHWSFGDGSVFDGALAQHTYAQTGTSVVTLAVVDDQGAVASRSETVLTIGLTARGYRWKGSREVDLAWNGAAGMTFDIFRNGARIATVATTAFTDTVGKSSNRYVYAVCGVGTPTCSNEATVTF